MIAEIAHALGEAHKEGKRIVEFRCSRSGYLRLSRDLCVSAAELEEEHIVPTDELLMTNAPIGYVGEVLGTKVYMAGDDAPDLSVVTEVRPLTKEQVADALALIDTLAAQPTAHGPNPKDNTHG